jgi:hypothetical protein
MAPVDRPSRELGDRVAQLIGTPAVEWLRADGGYTPAERWVVQMADGRSAFVKAAVDDLTAGWLRVEQRVYDDLRAPFQPALLAWADGPRPILILEDLSGAFWPPPWDGDRVDAVRDALALVAAAPPPSWLPRLADAAVDLHGWQGVAEDLRPFLGLGLAGEEWLAAALPELIGASGAFVADGSQLLHLDVRSDNICFRDGQALLVDWNLAAVGNPRLDVAFWLPSLADEGGPQPDAILPDAGPEAAVVSGYFAARAGRPAIPTAPRVRRAQLAQLRQALPWAIRQLGLPPLS